MTLDTAQLQTLLVQFLAHRAGLAGSAVKHTVRWGWSEQGPSVHLEIEPVGNVVQLRPANKAVK